MHIPSLKAFSEAVARIHGETNLCLFPGAVFEAVEMLIPDVVITIDEFNTKTQVARSAANVPAAESDAWRQRLRELVPSEHPVFLANVAGGNDALQISDFVTERQLCSTTLYHDVFRPLGIRHQIVLPLLVPDHVAGVTISRWKKFRDDEVALAQMLAMHLRLAHIHAQRLSAVLGLPRSSAANLEGMRRNGITEREAEVLHWIIQGKRDAEIATILGASVRTVHKHVQRLLEKLQVETRTAAALRGIEIALTPEPQS